METNLAVRKAIDLGVGLKFGLFLDTHLVQLRKKKEQRDYDKINK